MEQTSSETYSGDLLVLHREFVFGWARCNVTPEVPVVVEVYGDDQPLAIVRAALTFPAGFELPQEAANAGFVAWVPQSKLDLLGRITARIANTPYMLPGTLLPSASAVTASRIPLGSVENHGGLRLWGWVQDLSEHVTPLKVSAYEHGQLLQEASANLPRPELADLGLANIHCGFSLTLPATLADGKMHTIDVITENGQPLQGSPITVVFALPPTPLSWLDTRKLNSADKQVLKNMIERWTRYVPLSLDFEQYPSWFERFGQPPAAHSKRHVLVIVSGVGDVRVTVDSLISQTHAHWTCLCATEVGSDDPRIRLIESTQLPSHLVSHWLADDGLVTCVEAGDRLLPWSLATAAAAFEQDPVAMVYSDCDSIAADGKISQPWFKPDWDPDLAVVQPLLNQLCLMRARNLADFDQEKLSRPQSWPWHMAAALVQQPGSIRHLPYVLYRRRSNAPLYADHAAQQACLNSLAPGATLLPDNNEWATARIVWADPQIWPNVTLIVPTRDHVELLQRCMESLLKTDYPAFDIIVVDNDSCDLQTLDYLKHLEADIGLRVMRWAGAFNFAAINNAAALEASGEIVGFINNDIDAHDPQWLKAMVRQLGRPGVGAVGAKLLWPNGMVQHAGVVTGLHGLVGHVGNTWAAEDAGYFGLNQLTRSASAVTAACLLCRKQNYLALGGMDAKNLAVAFNDVDFCLRMREAGLRIIWTPEARLIHAESSTRGKDDTPAKRARLEREKIAMRLRWGKQLDCDPYYNPNLNLDSYSHTGLAIPPRCPELAFASAAANQPQERS